MYLIDRIAVSLLLSGVGRGWPTATRSDHSPSVDTVPASPPDKKRRTGLRAPTLHGTAERSHTPSGGRPTTNTGGLQHPVEDKTACRRGRALRARRHTETVYRRKEFTRSGALARRTQREADTRISPRERRQRRNFTQSGEQGKVESRHAITVDPALRATTRDVHA